MSVLHQASSLVRTRGVGASAPGRGADTNPAGCSGATLGIVSGKGGVGKTLLAVNLATAMAEMGVRTLLVDGDAGLTNADLMLGRVPRGDLDAWVAGEAELSDLVCSGRGEPDLLLSGRARESHRRLREALAGHAGGPLTTLLSGYEIVVLDLGAGIGSGLVELAGTCSRVWLVAVPEPTSLADAYAMTKQLTQRRPEQTVELIVNQVADRVESERAHVALERMTARFLDRRLPMRGALPRDAAVTRSIAKQVPVVRDAPRSPIARRVRLLSEGLLEEQRGQRAVEGAADPGPRAFAP